MVAVASSLHELIMVHSRHSQLRYFLIVANCEISVNLATSIDVVHGRLANPDCTLGTDPRSDPRMVKAFAQFGLDNNAPVLPFTVDSPLEERRAFAGMVEEGIGARSEE